jgi:hypothetical protein
VEWICLAEDGDKWWAVPNFGVYKIWGILAFAKKLLRLEKDSTPRSQLVSHSACHSGSQSFSYLVGQLVS